MSVTCVGVSGTSGMTVTRISVGCVDVCCGVVRMVERGGKPSYDAVRVAVVTCACCVVCTAVCFEICVSVSVI